VENILSEAKFPYKPALPEQEPQQPRKLKITMKESKTGVFSEENIVDKKKTENSETVLASNCAGATGNAIALCEHATDQGVNGWTTYPDKIRMMVGMDGYAWCLCTESIKWPYYLEVVTYPEYIVKYTYPFGSTYDYGVEIGVDAGLYDMNNNVTMQTQVGIRVYDWITQQHCLTIGDVESKNWPYVMKGDCDLDGVIDCTSDDLLLFLSFWNNTATPALGDQQYAADVDDNGTIDAYDLLALLQKIDQVC